jgi:hypothetical protein
MKLHHLFPALLFLIYTQSWSQVNSDRFNPPQVHKKYATIKFSLNNENISKREFENMMRDDYTSYYYFRKGNSRDILSNTLSLSGLMLVLSRIPLVFGDADMSIYPAAIGLVLFSISMPILKSASKNYKIATKKYAAFHSNEMSYVEKNELSISISNNSIGLKIKL